MAQAKGEGLTLERGTGASGYKGVVLNGSRFNLKMPDVQEVRLFGPKARSSLQRERPWPMRSDWRKRTPSRFRVRAV